MSTLRKFSEEEQIPLMTALPVKPNECEHKSSKHSNTYQMLKTENEFLSAVGGIQSTILKLNIKRTPFMTSGVAKIFRLDHKLARRRPHNSNFPITNNNTNSL